MRVKNLEQNQVNEIKDILNQFGVIFIKKQSLDPEAYQNFAKSIGTTVIYPRLKGLDKKFPFINVIERKPEDKNLQGLSKSHHLTGNAKIAEQALQDAFAKHGHRIYVKKISFYDLLK